MQEVTLSERRAAMSGHTKNLLFTCASVVALTLTPPHACAKERSLPYATVRPCFNRDWQLAFTPDAKQLTRSVTEYIGGFSSCEAAVVPFLPNARILRLHTPVDVDSSRTATLLQAEQQGTLRLISSTRGMALRKQPDAPESIAALNFLLAGAQLPGDKTTLRTIGDLYFFILDNEDDLPFRYRTATREERLDKHASKALVEMTSQAATVTYPKRSWQFTFDITNGKIQLALVRSVDH